MKKFVFLLVTVLSFAATIHARTISVVDSSIGSDRWVRQFFVKNKKLPFSFLLDGKESDSFLHSWSRRLVVDGCDYDGKKCYTLELTSPDKAIRLNCDITAFQDFPAVEWVLNFTNISDENSPRISNVNVADIDFTTFNASPDWKLYTAQGINSTAGDFHLLTYSPVDTVLHFRPSEGRSSSVTAFPFYNLSRGGSEGMCIAIGWSGTWFADFSASATNKRAVDFKTGMEGMDLFLYPGESIRTPRVALVQWRGTDRMEGNNTLRRFMLAHHSPRLGDGTPVMPPLCMGFDFGDPAPCGEYESLTELLGRAIVERHRNFDIMPEVFWLDAGWSEGNNAPVSSQRGFNWYNTVGSWEADSVRFPRGLRPVADDIHRAGAKFMVWFEPERVYQGSKIDREHPEWLLYSPDGNRSRLLNLGNPDALEYICETIGDFIEKSGIDYYRQDFNLAPDIFWAAADEPGRTGITQIRHIENLYKFWDYLLARFPGMIIDNCASGGRRIDLETCSRAIPLWRTDCHYGEPTCQQSHEYGLAQFLPLHGTGVYTTDVYCTRSGMSSAYLWAGEIFSTRNPLAGIRNTIDVFKELRPYYMADFYPLSGEDSTLGKDRWIAWQFHDPESGEGILQVFRRDEAPDDTYTVRLYSIDKETGYELTDYDNKETEFIAGDILGGDFTISLPQKRSSKLYRYKPMKK